MGGAYTRARPWHRLPRAGYGHRLLTLLARSVDFDEYTHGIINDMYPSISCLQQLPGMDQELPLVFGVMATPAGTMARVMATFTP